MPEDKYLAQKVVFSPSTTEYIIDPKQMKDIENSLAWVQDDSFVSFLIKAGDK